MVPHTVRRSSELKMSEQLLELIVYLRHAAPLYGLVPGILILVLAVSFRHNQYAAFGMAVMFYAAIVAIPHSLYFIFITQPAIAGIVEGEQDALVGAFAAVVSSICTVGSCAVAAVTPPTP
jgi:FtsH-binding integral membrane protein